MTQEQHIRLAELLQLFNTVEPEEIEALDNGDHFWLPSRPTRTGFLH